MILGDRLSHAVSGTGGRVQSRMRAGALAALLATTLICAWRVYADTFADGRSPRLDLGFQTYYHINTIVQSIAVFLLFANTDLRVRGESETKSGKRKIRAVLCRMRDVLARDSYGIYLVHIMVISTLWHFRIYWAIGHPAWSVPLLTAVVATLSLAVVRALSSIPKVGKYLIGS